MSLHVHAHVASFPGRFFLRTEGRKIGLVLIYLGIVGNRKQKQIFQNNTIVDKGSVGPVVHHKGQQLIAKRLTIPSYKLDKYRIYA